MNKEKTAQRIAQIVEATFKCIAEKGYGNVTMNSIAAYADLSKGAINHYFKNKQEILVGVLNDIDNKLYQKVYRIKDETDSKLDLKYRLGLNGGFALIKNDMTLMYVLIDFLSQASNNPHYLETVKGFIEKYRELSSQGVKSGSDAGVYKNVKPESIGAVVLALFLGIGMQRVLDEDGFDFDEVTRVAEEMLIAYIAKEKEDL